MPSENALFRTTHWGWTAASLACIAAVGAIDFLTGARISFSVFYLIPVAIAAWSGGVKFALGASAFAAFVWFGAELASSRLDSNIFVYVWNFCARLLFLLLVAVLLARLRLMLQRERSLSRTDPLTGLLNIRAFRELAEAEVGRRNRYPQPLSLAFIDVDDFKRVNDAAGHRAGDRLLARIAEVIRSNLRVTDAVARYGGDEFVVLLPSADQLSARATVDKLSGKLREAMSGERWPVTLSIGVITCEPGTPIAVDAMLERADRLMYEVKTATKGNTAFATVSG